MDTRLLHSPSDLADWKAALAANRDVRDTDIPESYPAIVAWVVTDDPHSSWWNVWFEFIRPSDFQGSNIHPTTSDMLALLAEANDSNDMTPAECWNHAGPAILAWRQAGKPDINSNSKD